VMMTNFRKYMLIGMTALSFGSGALTTYAANPGDNQSSTEKRADSEAHMKERMAKRQAELHDKLKLTPQQEGAWKTFTARMQPGTRPARPDRAQMANMTAPERMEMMLTRMKEAEARMTDRLAATKEFYAVLTPEQQKIFDQEFARHGGQHRGMHR
jgi:periplasmic protein CpxP/Spy